MASRIHPFVTTERINGKLAYELEQLRKSGQRHTRGDYYIVNVCDDVIQIQHLGSGEAVLHFSRNNCRQAIAESLDRMTMKGRRVAAQSKSTTWSPTGVKAQRGAP